MEYTNSTLVTHTHRSPSRTPGRVTVAGIVPHCTVCKVDAARLGEVFADPRKEASCNYGVGYDGSIALVVDEKNTSWCTSNRGVDSHCIAIEIASENYRPYKITAEAEAVALDLMEDICRRYGKHRVTWLGDKTDTLAYKADPDEMVFLVHRWFANKACPGEYIMAKLPTWAAELTRRLGGNPQPVPMVYRVQLGAWRKKDYAEAYMDKVAKSGYTPYMVKDENGLYRLQCGAFADKANADKLLAQLTATGYSGGYVTTVGNVQRHPHTVKVGDVVRLDPDAVVYTTGAKFAYWVYNTDMYVRELHGQRAVVSTQPTGPVTGAVHVRYLHPKGV